MYLYYQRHFTADTVSPQTWGALPAAADSPPWLQVPYRGTPAGATCLPTGARAFLGEAPARRCHRSHQAPWLPVGPQAADARCSPPAGGPRWCGSEEAPTYQVVQGAGEQPDGDTGDAQGLGRGPVPMQLCGGACRPASSPDPHCRGCQEGFLTKAARPPTPSSAPLPCHKKGTWG